MVFGHCLPSPNVEKGVWGFPRELQSLWRNSAKGERQKGTLFCTLLFLMKAALPGLVSSTVGDNPLHPDKGGGWEVAALSQPF